MYLSKVKVNLKFVLDQFTWTKITGMFSLVVLYGILCLQMAIIVYMFEVQILIKDWARLKMIVLFG